MKPTKELVILAAKRTPFGGFGGSLKNLSATDLGVIAAEAALDASGVDKGDIDHVVFGNVCQTSADAIYLARHVGLRAGIGQNVPALTINRLCGSGFQALINGAELILTGQAKAVLTGGAESMSQAPHVVRGARWGLPLGRSKMEDSLWECLTDSYNQMPMAITAENIAERYGISQDEVDAYSVASQDRYEAGLAAGKFTDEICPVVIKSRKGEKVVDADEHPRPGTTVEGLARLPKVFKKDGVIHAGAASGICDGAGALIIADGEWARAKGLKPLATLESWGVVGCDPDVMGLGPVEASRAALDAIDKTADDMEMLEINEAFAPQVLGCVKELGWDLDKVNVNGGAIAVGHPLAASGARITAHLVHNVTKGSGGYALGSACIGGGQGIAVVVKGI